MNDIDAIETGRQAWQRLRERERKLWQDWMQVGHALQVGRTEALKAAGTNVPFGKVYTRFMAEWLRANQFDDIGQQVRYRLLQCMENIAAIEKWRSTLDEQRLRRFNHPDSVWSHWRQSTAIKANRKPVARPPYCNGTANVGRSIYFSQGMVRRAAIAIGENWSNDTFRLAAVALHAAIRNEQDLLEFFPPDPPPKPALPVRSAKRISAPATLELA
ncbi:hypothetical protein V1283_003781 [Bradyrhizobium sp. AZCC 2262]|uniref:hypothetical protein n=1 Tax=Bradyrhizobium sp. AZCC 2262 TaxID=3117022 RepID=UPI002FF3CFC0